MKGDVTSGKSTTIIAGKWVGKSGPVQGRVSGVDQQEGEVAPFANLSDEDWKEIYDEINGQFGRSPLHSIATIGVTTRVNMTLKAFILKRPQRLSFGFPSSPLPHKAKFADAILLFVCKPDDAESAAGDLFEELEKVKSRHGSWYCNVWFLWELSLLVILKGRKKLTKSVFGPIIDLWKRKSG